MFQHTAQSVQADFTAELQENLEVESNLTNATLAEEVLVTTYHQHHHHTSTITIAAITIR